MGGIVNPKRRPGERYLRGSYCQGIRRACISAGIPAWTPGQLRKTAATVTRSSHDLETAAAVLGHTDPKTTGRHYAKLDFERAAEAMRKIGCPSCIIEDEAVLAAETIGTPAVCRFGLSETERKFFNA